MVIDRLLHRLGNQGLWAQSFTDDVVILINRKFWCTGELEQQQGHSKFTAGFNRSEAGRNPGAVDFYEGLCLYITIAWVFESSDTVHKTLQGSEGFNNLPCIYVEPSDPFFTSV
jgi:hypothetical protein